MEKARVRKCYQRLLQAHAEWKDACRSQEATAIGWQLEAQKRFELAKEEWMRIAHQWKAIHESHTGRDVSSLCSITGRVE